MEFDPIFRFNQEQELRWGITLPKLGKAAAVTMLAYMLLASRIAGFALLFVLLVVLVMTYLGIASYQRLVPRHYLSNLWYYAFTPAVLEVTNDSNPLPLAVPRTSELTSNKAKPLKKKATDESHLTAH